MRLVARLLQFESVGFRADKPQCMRL